MNINPYKLNKLGLYVDGNQANDEGWLTISSPFRADNNPSFAFNVNHGGWKDNATGQSGNIYELVLLLNPSMTFPEAKEFVDGKGGNKSIALKKPAYHTGLNSPFWTIEQKERLKAAHERLNETTSSPLLEAIESHDGLRKETLVKFGCGITDHYFDGEIFEALIIPYPTGAQVYTRGPNGKMIRMWEGSDPTESFMGTANLQRKRQLLITKSPREMMLLYQELGATFDVIGICSGETEEVSEKQAAYLKSISRNYERVLVSFDRDTTPAEKIAFGFAQHVCDAIGNYKREIRLLNIEALGGPDCKDLTDLIKAKGTSWLEKLLGDEENYYSNYVWNSVTQNNRFWWIDDKGKLHINEVLLERMMRRNGFKKAYLKSGGKPSLVHDKDNVLDAVSNHQMADFIMENIIGKYSRVLDHKESDAKLKPVTATQIRSLFYKYRDKALNSNITMLFKNEKPDIMTDTSSMAYLYFENGVLKVSKDSVDLMDYQKLPKKVWKSQVLNRCFDSQVPSGMGEFEKFIENLAAQDPDRIKSFRSVLGYLAHSYKNKAVCPAIILVDEHSTSDRAEGGTGKGLLAKSLEHIRQFNGIPAKDHDPNSRFRFSLVKHGDQIIHFEDVKREFDFESLFNVITDDMQVEEKHKGAISIPFAKSPKIIVSTNYYIKGRGSSFRRRQFILPLSDHYHEGFTPSQEFGHLLFSEWDEKEWHKYDHYMVGCIQLFLKNGLVPCKLDHYRCNILTQSTSPEFVKWAESHLETDVEYKAHVLFEGRDKTADPQFPPNEEPVNNLGEAFPCFVKASKAIDLGEYRTFISWIRQFVDSKGWRLHERKSNGYSIISFKK